MTILADHVAGGVAIAVLRVVVGSLAQKGLKHCSVSTYTSYMKGRAQIFGSAI